MQRVFGKYLITQVPGWGAAAMVLWALQQWAVLSIGVAAAVFAVWITKDLLLFPKMRRFFEPESAGRRMVGERGTAVTTVGRAGLVRVHGELWKARSEQHIVPGSPVLVRDVEGLTLVVAPTWVWSPPEPDAK